MPPEYRAPAAAPVLPTAPPVAGATRYAVRSDLSDVRFLVYRTGLLATLGHNHVVQAKTISGEIYLARDFHRSTFSLVLPVADFQVDAVAARSVEGKEFTRMPDPAAIAGTTKNMLGSKVLDAPRYPQVEVRLLALTGPDWAPDVSARIKLRDVERDITAPVAIDLRGDQLVITSVFEINQTDFGIAPLSLLGGALQVANSVKVRMRLVAQKAPD